MSTHRARRACLALAGLVIVTAGLVVAPPDASRARGAAAVDARIGRADCALLGRTYVAGRGCSRRACVRGARIANPARGAEVCALRGQGRHAFAAAVEYRTCTALHRRWIPQVNLCASNADRDRVVIPRAPQCRGSATTYITHKEREGWHDQCLRPREVRRLRRMARREGTTLQAEASRRSETLCEDRPRHVFEDGRCVPGIRPDVEQGGVLLVGDSIAWRGTDELGELRPDVTIDGMPSRRLEALRSRLGRFRLDHGDPTGLIVELGTNADPHTTKTRLRRILGSLPEETVVLFVLPYRQHSKPPPVIQPSTTRYARWMRELARERANTCAADWRAVVQRRPRVLVDGVHPTSAAESFWAVWVSRAWRACTISSRG